MKWGVESDVVDRFVAAGVRKENISCVRDSFTFDYPAGPAALVDAFRDFYGPTMNAYEAAEKNGKAAELHNELNALFAEKNESPNKSVASIPATFMRVTVTV